MKNFIKRFKEAFKYGWAYEDESFPMKILVGVFTCFYMIFCLVLVLASVVAIPLWVVPYIIYCTRRNSNDRT
jgi:hypothetical protein